MDWDAVLYILICGFLGGLGAGFIIWGHNPTQQSAEPVDPELDELRKMVGISR